MTRSADRRPRFLRSQLEASTAARVLGGVLAAALCGSLLWTGQQLLGPVGPVEAVPLAPPADCRLPGPAIPQRGREHEGITDYSRWLRPQGTIRAAILYVDFPDQRGTVRQSREAQARLVSAVRAIRTSSYQRVSVTLSPHTRWHLMPHPSSHYSDYQTFAGQKRYLQDAVDVVSSAGSIDFSDVSILYLVAPPTAQVFTSSPAFIANPRDGVIAGGKMVRHGVTFGRDFVGEAQGGWGFKVVNHETGHLFGLPDLYNYQQVPNIHAAAGGWDMMGLISGPAPDYLAWHRWKMAWLADAQVTCMTARGQVTQVLRPLHETGGGVRAVVVRTGPQRAVVVENRQANTLDKGRCFRAGVLVYTVDASVEGGQWPVRVVDGHPGTGTSGCNDQTEALDDATLRAGELLRAPVNGVQVRVNPGPGPDQTVRITYAP